MDPHEKVSMDAGKIMSGSWDFEFMVKQTLKKLARTIKFHITHLGPEAGTMMEEPVGHPGLQRHGLILYRIIVSYISLLSNIIDYCIIQPP